MMFDDYEELTMECPQCGGKCDYWEGLIDQDIMGNDIDGYNFVCPGCGWESEIKELD